MARRLPKIGTEITFPVGRGEMTGVVLNNRNQTISVAAHTATIDGTTGTIDHLVVFESPGSVWNPAGQTGKKRNPKT